MDLPTSGPRSWAQAAAQVRLSGWDWFRRHGQDAGAGADIKHGLGLNGLHAAFDQGQRHAGRGVLSGAEGHARVHLDDRFPRCRLIVFPGWFDDQTRDDGKGFEKLLPTGGPILISQEGCADRVRDKAVQGEERVHFVFNLGTDALSGVLRLLIGSISKLEKTADSGSGLGFRALFDTGTAQYAQQVCGRFKQRMGTEDGNFQPLPPIGGEVVSSLHGVFWVKEG